MLNCERFARCNVLYKMKRGEEKQKQIPMCESYAKISLTDRTIAIRIKFNVKQQKGDILRLAHTLR